MKPEGRPVTEPTDAAPAPDLPEADETKSNADDTKATENKAPDESYDKSADGFHGKSLPGKHVKDAVGDEDDDEDGGTFLTAVKENSAKKKMLTREDEDLGIYEDTDDNGDDLSDTELELERLRAEKKKREQEEKDKLIAEQKLKQQNAESLKADDTSDRQAEIARNVRSLTESAIKQIEKQIITPRTDISMDSRMSSKSWSDPRFLQGMSIRDLHWKTEIGEEFPIRTCMQAEILQSR